MKKLLLTLAILTILFSTGISQAQNFIELQKGAFLLAYPKKMISTAKMQEGDSVYFIAPADVWVNETKIIPKNSVFIGYVDMLKMPIKGINAAFSMKIKVVVFPDGKAHPLSATVSNGSNTVIGGDLAPAVSYNKMAHLYRTRFRWSGTTQWVPSGDYEMGRHVSISPRDKVNIILDEAFAIPEGL